MNENLIMDVVARYTGISTDKIKGSSREKEIVAARHLYCYFVKYYTRLSLKAIGRTIGNKDHSTVINAIQKVNDAMDLPKSNVLISKHFAIINQRLTAPKRIYNKYRTGTIRRWWR